jgi:hypothetical protein
MLHIENFEFEKLPKQIANVEEFKDWMIKKKLSLESYDEDNIY